MAKKSNSSFLLHGSILAITAIVVRIIGLLYRIPMVNIIGREGMAYYSGAFQVYNVMLLISSYSMPAAISRMISQRMALKEYRNACRLMRTAFLAAAVIGTVFGLITFAGAGFFAGRILRMPAAAPALRVLAPAVFVMAFLGVLRGFFQGLRTMLPTAVSQLAEQIVNAVVSVAAAWYLFRVGMGTAGGAGSAERAHSLGAAGGTLGTTMGALTALIFVLMLYTAFRPQFVKLLKKDRTKHREDTQEILTALALTVLPIIASTASYNIIDLVDNAVFGNYITRTEAADTYESVWGAYSGMVLTLIHVPVSFSSAIAVSLMPSVTAAHTKGDQKAVSARVGLALQFAMLIAVPSAVGLAVLASPVMALLFSRSGETADAAAFLHLGAVSIIFMSLSTVMNAILQGVGRLRVPVIHALISLAIHTGVMAVLLWGMHMGIEAVIISYALFALCMSLLNGMTILREHIARPDLMKILILPGLCAVIMGIVVFALKLLLTSLFHSNAVTVLIGVLAGVAVYAAALLLSGAVTERELADFPMGGRIARLARKLGLLQ